MSQSEKTEQPTSKKLRDARKKGQVGKSQEVASTAVVLAVFAYIWVGGQWILDNLLQLAAFPASLYSMEFLDALDEMLAMTLIVFIKLSLPLLILVVVAGAAANLLQIGFLFALEPAKPGLDKINPQKWFKKVFSVKNAVELVKSVLKIVLLLVIIKHLMELSLHDLTMLPEARPDDLLELLAGILKMFVLYCGAAFLVISAVDYFFQKRQHIKELKMTKDEVKREYKEMEGDPHIKGKRRQLHQELIVSNSLNAVRKSSVLVTNPTRLAVALFYDEDQTPLPVVLAKGEGMLARRMVEVAREEGIPVMQNVPLAQDLFAQADVEQYIPGDLIEPVAEVLRWVRDMTETA
jgi:type III secretion protein U